MNVNSQSFMENRSFQLKPYSLFGKFVNLVGEGNKRFIFLFLFLFCSRSAAVFINVEDILMKKAVDTKIIIVVNNNATGWSDRKC